MISSGWVYFGLDGIAEFWDRKDLVFWLCYFRVVVSIILKIKFRPFLSFFDKYQFRKIHSQYGCF